jgi:urease accessory protein
MRLITEAPAPVAAPALAGKARDTLRLTWEERRWTRKKTMTTAGRDVALALPTGTVLEPGDVLAVEEHWYLVVEARPEPVLALFPENHEAAVRIAFDVGNRHSSLGCDGDTLLVPDDTAMADLVRRLGVRWERREVVYSPIDSAERGGGHD